MIKEKYKKILVIIFICLILILFSTISYSFFKIDPNNLKNLRADLTTGELSLVFEDGDKGINAALNFGETVTKKFKITNTGNVVGSLSLDWDKLINTYSDGSLSYSLTYQEEESGDKIEILPKSNIPTSEIELTQTLASEISVPANTTYFYNLNITLNNTDFDQEQNLQASFQTQFDVGQPAKYRYYTLIVDPAGGTWNNYVEPQEYQLQYDDTMNIPAPTREGYTFDGWNVKGTNSKVSEDSFIMGIANTVLTPKWSGNRHEVKIIIEDNTETKEMSYGDSILLTEPSKEGYTFIGWSVTGGTIKDNIFTLTSDENVTITANFRSNTFNYKIIYRQMNIDGNGYTIVDIETGNGLIGTSISHELKNYLGFTAPQKQEKIIEMDSEDPTKNVITYDYIRNKYTLTIDTDGGDYSGSKSIEMYFDSTTNINNPSKSGYTFSNWNITNGEMSGTVFTIGSSDAKITAKWVPNDYNYIVYHKKQNTDGSTYATFESTSGTAKYGSTVNPDVKTYSGFTSPSKGSLRIQIDTDIPPKLNVLNYQYARNKYNLTINLNGGTVASGETTKSMFYEDSLTLSTPIKSGYTFKNWTNNGGTLNGSTFTMSEPKASTVTANWEINQYEYTVNHYLMNTDGTTYTLDSTNTATVDYGTEVTPATKSFTGFNIPTMNTIIVSDDSSKNIVNYYYSRKQFTLTINPNGGTYSDSTSLTKYYGENVTIGTPTKTGYTYSWSKSGEGILSGSTFTVGNGNATLTANWTPKTYTVTYNANGGTPVTQSKTVAYDTKYVLPDTEPTREGYQFLGWFTSTSGGTTVTTNTDVKLSANQTLYAQWKKLVTVTLLAGGGSFDKDGTIKSKNIYVDPNGTYGDQLVSTYYNSKEPYTGAYSFTQWSTLPETSSNPITSTTKVTNISNHTLYAIYEGGCFLANTLIYTPDGYKKIQDIEIGDKIYSYNEETGKKEVDKIIDTIKHENLSWLEVTLKDKTKIRLTANHSVYDPIKKEWKFISEFKKGDFVLNSKGKMIKITKIESHYKSATVYNFTVQKNHNYFVTRDNVLVHNASSNADNFHGGEDIVVTFDAIGNGTGGYFDGDTSNTTKKLIIKHTGVYGNLPTPSNNNGRSFDGWYTEKSGGTKVVSTTQISKSYNHILYAHWSGGCFLADTLIYTPNGYRKIQDIEIGDKVYSFNEKTQTVEVDEVENTISHPFDSVEDITFEDHTIMHVTWNHPIYDPINKKWKEAVYYQVGDYVQNDKQDKLRIINKTERKESFTVYNLTVKNNHNYFVTEQNILVHNAVTI